MSVEDTLTQKSFFSKDDTLLPRSCGLHHIIFLLLLVYSFFFTGKTFMFKSHNFKILNYHLKRLHDTLYSAYWPAPSIFI